MTSDPYPLEHWTARRLPLPPSVARAVNLAAQIEDDATERVLDDGSRIVPLAGGNHSVGALHVDGRAYCLKLLRPTTRRPDGADCALVREVGGLCVFTNHAPGRAPSPIAWNASPAWVLAEWLPGQPLGNQCLTDHQLSELASATQEICTLTPRTAGERLWDIDWPIQQLLDWQRQRYTELTGRPDEACAEAAALVSDWLASDDPVRLLEDSDQVVFSRGDQNLANALWDGQTVRFVDFEYCGWNDLPLDLSLLTEHIQSYETPIDAWETYIDRFGLTRRQRLRTLAGRRRQALSWLTYECLAPGCLHSCPEERRLERLLDRARRLCRDCHA